MTHGKATNREIKMQKNSQIFDQIIQSGCYTQFHDKCKRKIDGTRARRMILYNCSKILRIGKISVKTNNCHDQILK